MITRLFFLLLLLAGLGALIWFTEARSMVIGSFHYLQGNLAYKEGQYETASSAYMQALEGFPYRENVLVKLGDVANREENVQAALSYYKQAMDFNPNSTVAVNRLANLHWKLGNRRLALGTYQMALRNTPADSELRKNYGITYLKLAKKTHREEDFQEAVSILQEAHEERQQDDDVKFALAEGLYLTKQYRKALPLYCQLAKNHPYSAETLYSLSLTLAKNGAYPLAAEKMADAVEAMSEVSPVIAEKWTHQVFTLRQQAAHSPNTTSEPVQACVDMLASNEKKASKQETKDP